MSAGIRNPRLSRVAAVLLLAGLLLVVYLLAVHWWFTAPFLEARSALIEARDQEQRLRAIAQLRGLLEQELQKVRQFEAGNPEFLVEENFDLAASAIIARIDALVEAQQAGAACTVISRSPARSQVEEPFERVTVKVRMRCAPEYLAPVIHGLEAGSPPLFVDQLAILNRSQGRLPRARTQVGADAIDANFDVYGYLRKPRERKEGA